MIHILFLVMCLFSSVTHAEVENNRCQNRHCVAIVDAGSTGSRLHIYAYDLDSQERPIAIEQLWSKKVKPGLASIEPNQAAIDAYMNNLFDQAPEQNIPLYLYATAGMRLLSESKQHVYYNLLNHWVETQTQWTLMDVKTISGSQEGVFGWLAVNYKLGALQSANQPLAAVMDMGGASVQVSIPVEHSDLIDAHNRVEVNAYDKHVTLFVHSFLGLGQTELSHQYLNDKYCFPVGYPLPDDASGEGQASICQQDISRLINLVHHVDNIVKPVVANNPATPWYAISGVSMLVQSQPFYFKNDQFTSQDILNQADQGLCQQSWQTLNARFFGNDSTYMSCLSASYYYALMVNGYGLQPTQAIHYMASQDEPDWTLGVVIEQSSKLLK